VGKSARGLAQSKTLARNLYDFREREASWSAAALRRFRIEQARSPVAHNVTGNGEVHLPVQDEPDIGGG